VTYYVEFSASCAESSITCLSGNGLSTSIGAYISVTAPSSAVNTPLPFTPQVVSTGSVNATTGWTLISGIYTAIGGEQFITIGNFNTDALTTVNNGPVTGSKNSAYYYIEDVCVSVLGGAGCFVILPIELLSFNAHQEKNFNMLNWQTTSEKNNDYFLIERSENGIDFKNIGKVIGAGNSDNMQSYSFLDKSPMKGMNYYRLMHIDYNGYYNYTNIISILPKDFQITSFISPNPISNSATIEICDFRNTNYDFVVYNLFGEEIMRTKIINQKSKIERGSLSGGIYYYQLTNEDGVQATGKLLID
jgi:hypothetical protein